MAVLRRRGASDEERARLAPGQHLVREDVTRLTCDIDHDEPGFWERLGCSDTADPWKEERYGF